METKTVKAEYLCPALTFFRDGEVDFDAQHELYRRLVEGGIDGAIILGSSSEFYAMTPQMRRAVALDAIEQLGGKMKVYVGTGCLNVADTVAASREALDAGATGVIIVGPYYIDATPEGVYAYYDEVASQVDGDILIYNYPDRTGYDVTPDILNRLVDAHPNIVGIKDTVGNSAHTQAILNGVRPQHPDFLVYTGYDNNFLPVVLDGGNGCIGALSNIIPGTLAAWAAAVGRGDLDTCARTHALVCKLFELYGVQSPFMPAMKYVAQLQGVGGTCESMLPALPPTDEAKAQLEALYRLIEEYETKFGGK